VVAIAQDAVAAPSAAVEEKTMSERVASCGCGQLRITCEGEPVRISVCHCHACQRRTGSAFGVQARFPDGATRVDGRDAIWVRRADDGDEVELHFCPTCATTLFWRIHSLPGLTMVAVGAFVDPTFPEPKVSVWEATRHAWVSLPPGIEHVD
jgi:hypothetical protein